MGDAMTRPTHLGGEFFALIGKGLFNSSTELGFGY